MNKELDALNELGDYRISEVDNYYIRDTYEFEIIEAALRENEKLEEMLDNDEELIKTLERKFENELKCNQRLTKLHSDFCRASERRVRELQHYLVTLIDFLGIDNICVEKMQGAYYLFLGNNCRQMKKITEEEYNLFLKIKEEYKYGKK